MSQHDEQDNPYPLYPQKYGIPSCVSDIKETVTGAKTSGNLPPYECLTDEFIDRCAKRMQLGMHYGKHNWKKGQFDKEYVLERLRHAHAHLRNAMHTIDNDLGMKDDDLAAVAVNCMFAMSYLSQRVGNNLLPPQTQTKVEISTGQHLYKNGICTKCGLDNRQITYGLKEQYCDERLLKDFK